MSSTSDAPLGTPSGQPQDGDDVIASKLQVGEYLGYITAGLPADVVLYLELRLLDAPQAFGGPKIESGFFAVSSDVKTWTPLWRSLKEVLERGEHARPKKGVCVTLNPVLPDLLARANQKLVVRPTSVTADEHVVRRHLLLVDVDSVKRSGNVILTDIPATDAEQSAAHALADRIADDLAARGWPQPLRTDSGNGGALLYRIDLPADDGGLVGRVLKALAGRYVADGATVDTSVHNASRLTRVPGTWNAKGDDTPEIGRRHRMARIRFTPSQVAVVTREQLEALVVELQPPADPAPAPAPRPVPPAPSAGPPQCLAPRGRRGPGTLALLERARRYFSKVPGAVAGERNTKLYAVAARLIGSYGVSMNDVTAAALQVWAPKCVPPLESAEVDRVVRNAVCYNKGLPPPDAQPAPAVAPCADGGADAPPAAPAPQEPGTAPAPARPTIVTNRTDYCEVDRVALDALVRANEPPTVFVGNGGVLVQLHRPDADGPIALRRLDASSLNLLVARLVNWVRATEKESFPDFPPQRLLTSFPARGAWPGIPHLRAICTYPAYGPDWQLVDTQGYHRGTGIYCDLGGLVVPPVPEVPTSADVAAAKALLLDELLGDFPFADDGGASRANALAMFLLPLGRNAIDGPTPLGVIDAPAEGTGKSLLAEVIAVVTVGSVPTAMSPDMTDDEWRKSLLALLLEGQPITLLDNANRTLDSGALASALTVPYIRGRILGETRTVQARVNTCWVVTANNLTCSREIARRTYWVRIDARVETPSLRTGFRHPHLLRWARENRPRLLWALLVLIQNWRARGSNYGTATLGKFEEWAGVMSEILEAAGVHGFLANANAFRARCADQVGELNEFVEKWAERHPTEARIAGDLFGLAKGVLDSVLTASTDDGQRRQLGRFLAKHVGRVVGGYRIVVDGNDRSRRPRYRLELVSAATRVTETKASGG